MVEEPMAFGSLLSPYSVLMPLAPWEPPDFLEQALVSLLRQTWPPAQVLVSCDGSLPKPLLQQLKSVQLPLQMVLGPGGEGVGPVLARGLENCQYELVIRADADDISKPDRCALQVAWMQENPMTLVLGSAISEFLDYPEQAISQRWVPTDAKEIAVTAQLRNPMNHPSVILRRSAVLAVGNYRSMPGFEDYDLWLRLLAVKGPEALANVQQTLVCARVGFAHLLRRHGLSYALSEAGFFLHCGKEGLLPWWSVMRALFVRFPLRILPSRMLTHAMRHSTRKIF